MATNYFEQLKSELEAYRSLSSRGGHLGFFGQEVLRFHSIAGTLVEGCDFRLDESASNDERYFTHILVRSLLENYFWTIYLFDNPAQSSHRYEELKNSFKRDYVKLLNENHLPHKIRNKGSSIMLTLYGFGSTVQACRDQSELNMRTPTITL